MDRIYYGGAIMDKQAQDLANNFAKYGNRILAAAQRGITKAAIKITGDAKTLSPVDTGLLRKSLFYRVTRESRQVLGVVGTNVEYAAFQEFGTSRMEPQPYMKPALDQNKENTVNLVRNEIRKELA